MKIVIYSHSYLEPENQKNIKSLADFCDVRCVLPDQGPVLIFPHYKFNSFYEKSGIFSPYKILRVFRGQYIIKSLTLGLRQFKPDIINVEYNPWSLMFLQVIVCRYLFCRKAKLVCTVKKNTYYQRHGSIGYIKDHLVRCSLKWVDHIIAASKMAAKLLEINLFYPSHKITVCHHLGVDILLFKPKELESTDAKSPIIIGYCGRFDADKGVKDLVEAVRRVKRQISQPIVLQLLGAGAYSSSLDSFLMREAKKADWIKVLVAVPNREVADFLKKLDIFVLPSRKLNDHEEHDAHALLESLSSGVASVGTNSGIIPEILEDGSGLIVNPESPEELAEALIELISNRGKRQKMALLGRRKAEREFSLKEVAKKKYLVFKEVMNGAN